jgi:GT2 family glycosyltransferase
MTRRPDVSVIIVTWNGREHLDACLTAVSAQREVEAETILVDNASTDGTVDFVRAHFPWVRVVALDTNRGFAGGNNAGVREARGHILAFLNNDTVAAPDWLFRIVGALDVTRRVAFVTSRIVYMHPPGVIDSAGDGMTRAGGAFKRLHGAPSALAEESREVFGACGAAFAVLKDVFDEIGGFDEDFFASHEDVDLSYRARLRGYRCWYEARAVVEHRGSATLGRVSAFAVYQGQRNLEWAYFKNTPMPLLLRTLPDHLVYDAAAAVHFARLGLFGTFLRAKLAALGGLPSILRKRATVQTARTAPSREIWAQLEPRWIALKRREERFDVGLASTPPRRRRAVGTPGERTR